MQFKLATVFSVVAFAAPTLAQQVISYEGFANTVSCSGSAFGCTDGGAVCCSLPTGFGFSAQFNDLPSGAQGQGYTNGACSAFLFAVFGSNNNACWNGGGARATNLNWFHSPQGRRAVQAREAEAGAVNCSAPAYFKYEVASGTKKIKVPAGEGAAQTIADLYLAGDLTALAAYKDY